MAYRSTKMLGGARAVKIVVACVGKWRFNECRRGVAERWRWPRQAVMATRRAWHVSAALMRAHRAAIRNKRERSEWPWSRRRGPIVLSAAAIIGRNKRAQVSNGECAQMRRRERHVAAYAEIARCCWAHREEPGVRRAGEVVLGVGVAE